MFALPTFFWIIALVAASLVAHRWGTRSRGEPIAVSGDEILRLLPSGLAIVDRTERIQFANEAFAKLTGRSVASLTGVNLSRLPWIRSQWTTPPWRAAPVGDDEHLVLLEQPDGSRRLMALRVSPFNQHSLWLCRDVTQAENSRAETESMLAQIRHRRLEDQQSIETLTQLVQEDPLTRCRNRRALAQQASDAWREAIENQAALACLMFDIDHFKSINDNHGHAAGDEVLRRVSATLRETFAGVGHVYRYGGEEFCVLLPRHQISEAVWIGDRVRTAIDSLQIEVEETSEQGKHTVTISPTVSVGSSDRTRGAESAEELIQQADKCLYIAKRRGRNVVVAYDDEVAAANIRTADRRRR